MEPIVITNPVELYNTTARKGPEQIKRKAEGFQKMVEEAAGRMNAEKSHMKKRPMDKRLMDVCVEMESLFVARMLKEMRKTVHKNEFLHGGFAEEIFEDMLYDEYSLEISKNANMGLAKMLYDEMSGRS